MKKILIIYFISIVGLFFVPALIIKEKNVIAYNNLEITNKKIQLLITETNEVKELYLEEYIMGVLVGEMPVSYDIEALKTQAVVARTYTLNKILNSQDAHKNADMCDDINHCQAYKTKEYALACWDDNEENEKWNKIKRAVLETQNQIITYNNKIINAFFHANSGGRTEDISNIWGHENIPYLKSVTSLENDLRIEEKTLSYQEIDEIMKLSYPQYIELTNDVQLNSKNQFNLNGDNEQNIKIIEKNSSGRVAKLHVSNIILDGTDARTLFSLGSTLFEITNNKDEVIFKTYGYGHGIGLSQDGANAMAQSGVKYKEIIKHYYNGCEIEENV